MDFNPTISLALVGGILTVRQHDLTDVRRPRFGVQRKQS
jgi:hypothetical protein